MRPELNFYQVRLIRRELKLLATYAAHGRRPRIANTAYWRASSIPLAVGLAFFIARALALTDSQAGLTATALLMGLILADLHMFVANAPAWAFARKTLDWRRVADLHLQFVGTPLNLTTPQQPNQWDRARVPPSYEKNLARVYQGLRRRPKGLTLVVGHSPELRILTALTGLTLAALWLSPELRGFTLSLYFFLSAWNAKRLKAAVDFHMTWPVLSHAFSWGDIRRLSETGSA